MRSAYITSAAIAASGVLAVPAELAKPIAKRDWVNDENGNLKITFSDDTIKIGTVTIDDIFSNLADVCDPSGTCDTGGFSLAGQLIPQGTGTVEDIHVTVEPNGAYPTWIHNGLIDALKAAVVAVAECEDVTYQPTCPNPASYCPAQPSTYNECVVPRYISANYQPPDLGNAAPPFISADQTMTVDGDGFCETFTTVGSAVAGSVNGAAGGIFSLIGLACQ